jgi:predicted nucleotidyltransferase
MSASETIAILQNHREELRRFGVRRIGLFGSMARDEAEAGSDIDVLVDFEPGKKSFDNFMELRFRLEELFPGLRVDLVLQSALKPIIRANIESSVRYVA